MPDSEQPRNRNLNRRTLNQSAPSGMSLLAIADRLETETEPVGIGVKTTPGKKRSPKNRPISEIKLLQNPDCDDNMKGVTPDNSKDIDMEVIGLLQLEINPLSVIGRVGYVSRTVVVELYPEFKTSSAFDWAKEYAAKVISVNRDIQSGIELPNIDAYCYAINYPITPQSFGALATVLRRLSKGRVQVKPVQNQAGPFPVLDSESSTT